MFKSASSCSFLSLVIVAGAALIGCGNSEESVDDTTQMLSSDGSEAVESNDQSTSSLTDSTFEAVVSDDPSAAADALVAAPAALVDGKCRSRAKDPSDPNTVIITLTNCSRRFGRHSVSGKEIVHFTKGDPGTLHADFQSQDLTIDGKPATHTASADITIANGVRTVVWQGGFDTISEKGAAVSHTSDLTITVDMATHCRTRNGTAKTTIGGREMTTELQALQVCRSADGDASCPSGSVTHTRLPSGKSVTVAFDGTAQATVTGPNGATFEQQLSCEP